MRNLLLLGSAVLGLALLTWWATGGAGGEREVDGPEPRGRAVPEQRALPDALADELGGTHLSPADASGPEPEASIRQPAAIESCRLELRFVDHLSGAPVAGQVQVWQLGLAEDATWTAGDQRVFEGRAEDGVVVLEDLEPGLYRAYASAARARSAMPPAFELVDAKQVHIWPVVSVAKEELWLEVLDLGGTPVAETLEREARGWDYSSTAGDRPSWARERREKEPEGWILGMGGSVGGRGWIRSTHRSWRELERDAFGLLLGPIEQDSRGIGRNHRFGLRRASGGDAEGCEVTLRPRGHREFATVLFSKQDLASALVLPVGSDGAKVLGGLVLEADTVAFGEGTGRSLQDAWREVRVTVRLDEPAYEPLEASWQPGQAATPALEVRWREPAGGD
ncbi:MAG: hypothetical protein P1V81_09915 [Planctomycetota bacterium]|nr:hypothetical protein [Planctomycetota bacterium]